MVLRENHISVFQANWIDKATNLEAIAKSLNIGLDALVFLDDNPAERAQVRGALPMVRVPEVPEDPSWYAWILAAGGWFESVAFSQEDALRVQMVDTDAARAKVRASAHNLETYLKSLNMTISFGPFDAQSHTRVTQLVNKTNQFNLTTRRYTSEDIATLEVDPDVFTLQVRLKDRFGELGLISVIICRQGETAKDTWDIDTWLMSCRVLGRDVEKAVLAQIVEAARAVGITRLVGRYLPTAKNALVGDHYAKLGFVQSGDLPNGGSVWSLELQDYTRPELPFLSGADTGGATLASDAPETLA